MISTSVPDAAAQPELISAEWNFDPAIDFESYRSKWVKAKEIALTEFKSLESLSGPANVSFLKRLDALFAFLDFQANEAALWQNYHPEERLRTESEAVGLEVKKLTSEIASSPLLAHLLERVPPSERSDPSSERFHKFATREARRAGAFLDDEKKAKFREIGNELHEVMQSFQKAINDDDSYLMVDPSVLEPMPKDLKDSHPVDKETGKVKIAVQPSDYFTFLKYCEDDKTAERLWQRKYNRAPDNEDRLKRMIELRYQQAKMLGYESYAHFAMETCMHSDPVATQALMVALNEKASIVADREKLALAKMLDPGQQLQPWNNFRAEAKLLKQRFPDFDPLQVREFFPLKNVVSRGMALLEDLFQIKFRERHGVQVWHAFVRVFALYDLSLKEDLSALEKGSKTADALHAEKEGRFMGNIYVDLITRDNKNAHPYTFPIRNSVPGGPVIPSVVLGDCFGIDENACVDFDHCATLLHELGHCVHFLFAQNCEYYRFNGLNVEQDFGEAPSELLEGLMRDRSVVEKVAINKEGRSLPSKYLDALVAESELGKAMSIRSQTLYSLLCVSSYPWGQRTCTPHSCPFVYFSWTCTPTSARTESS